MIGYSYVNKDASISLKPLITELCIFIVMLVFEVDPLLILTTIIFVVAVFYCLKNFYSNVFFLIFLCSFYIFLISGDVAETIFNKKYYIQFNENVDTHSYLCTLLAIVFLFLGYMLTYRNKKKNNPKDNIQSYHQYWIASMVIFYVTYAIMFFDTLNKVIFVQEYGYVAYYSSYTSILPSIVVALGDFCPISLCALLATNTKKSKLRIPLFLYFINSFFLLLMGQRGGIVYYLCFVIGFYVYSNKFGYKEKWISKKCILMICLALPFIFVGLQLITYLRAGKDLVYNSFFDTLISFFVNIGSSSTVIKYGYIFQNDKFMFYSLGDIINYFKYSSIFNWITGNPVPSIHSAQFALEGHSFDAYISYMYMRVQYLAGEGAGSSFVAELYADFGYIGIIIGSFIYGAVFKSYSFLSSDSWLMRTIKLYTILFIIKTPRGSFSSPFGCVVNVSFWICIFLIIILSRGFSKKQ